MGNAWRRGRVGRSDESAGSVEVRALGKVYGTGDTAVSALRGITITFARASFSAVMGPSGSGKSTLLLCAAGLDRPTSGSVRLGGVALDDLNEDKLTVVRRQRVGFVFQAFNLVPALTVSQNITLPLRLAGVRPDRAQLRGVVARVGLTGLLQRRPAQLSGGQQQRVAIARALVAQTDVIFADEPTGALDLHTGQDILALLRDATNALGQTVIMVTHDPVAASCADRVVFLADGEIADEMARPTREQIAERATRLAGLGESRC